MTLYFIKDKYFCPMDNGLLQKEGQILLNVYGCPNCSTKYVSICEKTVSYGIDGISDGFYKPTEIRKTSSVSAKPIFELEMFLPKIV